MAHTSGTADGVFDLLDKLVDFLILQGWVVLNSERYTGLKRWWSESNSGDSDHPFHRGRSSIYTTAYDQEIGGWVAWEFWTAQELTAVRLQCPHVSGQLDRMIRDFRIQYSDDGIYWTSTADDYNDEGNWYEGEIRQYSVTLSGVHKFWRIKIDDNNNDITYTHVGAIIPVVAGGTLDKLYPHGRAILESPLDDRGPKVISDLRIWNDDIKPRHSIGCYGAPAYSNSVVDIGEGETDTTTSLINNSSQVFMPALPAGNSIPYDIIADEYRWCIAIDLDGRNYAMHCGYFTPYGSPNQYPFPVAVGGSMNAKDDGSNPTGDQDRVFVSPGDGSLYVYMPTNVWKDFTHSDETRNVWPTKSQSSYGEREVRNGYIIDAWSNSAEPQYMLLPFILHSGDPYSEVLGEFEGLYWISGYLVNAGDTFTIGADTYKVFQNGYRTGNSWMWAMKLA